MKDRNHRNESGQSILVIAFIVLVLLALVALVVDVGNAYAQRRIVQNAVDSAAMAGTLKLLENDPDAEYGDSPNLVSEIEVWQTINEYATANGLATDGWDAWFIDSTGAHSPDTVDQIGFAVPSWADGVEVQGKLPFDTYFAHLIGFDQMEVNADAPAYMLSGPCSGEYLFPLTINIQNFADDPGGRPAADTEYVMWDQDDKLLPGNFGWVYWVDGDGENRCPYSDCDQKADVNLSLRENINDTTRSGFWRVGDWVHGDVGVNFQPVLEDNAPGGPKPPDQLEYYTQSDAVVIVPIYDDFTGSGNNALFKIAGFGAFQLTCAQNSKTHYVERNPGDCDRLCGDTDKCITGEFVRWIDDLAFEDGCLETMLVAPSFRHPSAP